MAPVRRSILFALAALLALGPAVVHAKGKQPKKTDGVYKATVAGYYTGTGTATVSSKTITVTVKVTDANGNKGQFNAANMKLSGAHFRGVGKVMGQTVKITGRLDGYADEKGFRGARLLGSYTDAAGKKAGRLAGVIE